MFATAPDWTEVAEMQEEPACPGEPPADMQQQPACEDQPSEESESKTLSSVCPMPRFTPDFDGPARGREARHGRRQAPPVRTVCSMQECLRNAECKAELHRVLQAVQFSAEYGVFFCENFRDPRRQHIDDYWEEVCNEAIGIDQLHRAVGRVDNTELSRAALSRLHLFARLLERLARRIDRVVLASRGV